MSYGPGPNPIMVFSVNLRCADFKHFDWLKNVNSQSECLKIERCTKLHIIFFIGYVPGLIFVLITTYDKII